MVGKFGDGNTLHGAGKSLEGKRTIFGCVGGCGPLGHSSKRTPWLCPPGGFLKATSNHVANNHGVRRKNLEKLLYPLGVLETSLDQSWLGAMDSFGVTRGGWAQQTIGAVNPSDPTTELNNVLNLTRDLLKLDRILSGLR